MNTKKQTTHRREDTRDSEQLNFIRSHITFHNFISQGNTITITIIINPSSNHYH